MHNTKLERMIQLADEFFEVKNDPAQIAVTEATMARLREIHPSTLTSEDDENGPIAWILIIPTTSDVMEQFITNMINERELLELTPLHTQYNALYLCSALVLPEYRGKGFARRLLREAITSIRRDHPITSLFYWAFSVEGDKLAASMAREFSMPLHKRL